MIYTLFMTTNYITIDTHTHTFLIECSVRQTHSTGAPASARGYSAVESEPVSILHPDIAKAESLIRSAWQDAKLVAD